MAAMEQPFSVCRGLAVPVMDARRDNVYTAVFSSQNGGFCRLTEDMIIPAAELCDMLAGYDLPVFFTGDAYDKLTDMAKERGINSCSVPHPPPASAL